MTRSLPALAALFATAALAGCGGSSSPTAFTDQSTGATTTYTVPTVPKGAPQPPKGASATLQAIYRQFTPPKADPKAPASGPAIKAGIRACANLTPAQVKARYYALAVKRGALDPNSAEAKMIAQIGKYEKNAARDSGFTAGQLAADAYKTTLHPGLADYGYQGCVYAMARRLEHELAPKR